MSEEKKSVIVMVPDVRLRTVCDQCNGVTDEMARNMFMLLRQLSGVGLAAPQIGIMQRFFVIANGFLFCNPKITPYGTRIDVVESCLSIPDQSFKVPRYTGVHIESDFCCLNFEGFWSFVVQHEYDHLDGILIDVKGRNFSTN